MGIPAYFAHLIKNHNKIISIFNKSQVIDYFFLDSNSIIYDQIRTIEKTVNFENDLINAVCEKINEYIKTVNPQKETYIAFDGVAPVAKLEQQRTRRYKGQFEKILFNKKNEWNTSNITPGTSFMKNLSKKIKEYFKNEKNILISTSDEIGEGEHKIFNRIRKNNKLLENSNCFVYGLDADLIMLCLANLNHCKNLFLFRETPEFIKYIDKKLDPCKLYKINMSLLAKIICEKLHINDPKEYVFLFFLLGNDFIPHSPSINIRTEGINILQKTYIKTISSKNLTLVTNDTISWSNLRLLINELAHQEKNNIAYELQRRRRQENKPAKNKEDKYNLIPQNNREDEEFINPENKYWEDRYYTKLFDLERKTNKKQISKICINYLESLEWTFSYYIDTCKDWRWTYDYHYTPLFSDIYEFIPYYNMELIEKNLNKPVSPTTQLAYVLPRESLSCLTDKIKDHLINNHSEWYDNNCDFIWCFCKYIWECHIKLPKINLNLLENEINTIS